MANLSPVSRAVYLYIAALEVNVLNCRDEVGAGQRAAEGGHAVLNGNPQPLRLLSRHIWSLIVPVEDVLDGGQQCFTGGDGLVAGSACGVVAVGFADQAAGCRLIVAGGGGDRQGGCEVAGAGQVVGVAIGL